MNMLRRLKLLAERIAEQVPIIEVPPSSQWLAVLKLARTWFERQSESMIRETVLRRIDGSIVLIEEYAARHRTTAPWAYLEYFCRASVMRLSWTTNELEGAAVGGDR